MVRTKESIRGGSKRLGKVSVASPSSSPASKKGSGGSGIRGNTLVQRETPQWQKPITQFFPQPQPSSSSKHSDPDKVNVSTEIDISEKENVSTEIDISEKENVSTVFDKSAKKENVSLEESVPLDDKTNDDSD